ncbi:MAG TPA: hypothetical protein VHT94_17125 [Streptosporangiaceae bacterium]|nr:hypothetical protein [Streptosporangiaceae bacterium]
MAMHPATPGGGGDPAPEGTSTAEQQPHSSPPAGSPRSAHAAPPSQEHRRYRLVLVGFVLALIGLCASVGSVVLHVLPRTFSRGQQQQLAAWEIGKRWRTWPAGRIFPSVIPYEVPATALDSGSPAQLSATRIGIAPAVSCSSATGLKARPVLAAQHCTTVLRATYRDSTGAFAITVGIAVLPSPGQASHALRALHARAASVGVRAVPFGHTLAASFSDAARQLSDITATGPYLIMSTVGYADGRHRVRESADPYDKDEMLSVADGISDWIGTRIGASPPPVSCPGGPAC